MLGSYVPQNGNRELKWDSGEGDEEQEEEEEEELMVSDVRPGRSRSWPAGTRRT